MGLDLFVRLPRSASAGEFCVTETINAPGEGPALHRHREAEIFRVLEGRYVHQVDGRRFFAEVGDVVSVPGRAVHGFVNVNEAPARLHIILAAALDAAAFFTELAATMRDGLPDRATLNAFGETWQVEFLGPPLNSHDRPTE